MPNKYLNRKGIQIKKQKYKVRNWSEYNAALTRRGSIDIWISEEVIAGWYNQEQEQDGSGRQVVFTDLAIITCHELRKVFHQPLRQSVGFINSLFRLMRLPLKSPSYSALSKRLSQLNIRCPAYKDTGRPADDLAAAALDSTGLKRFGRDEWHQEKHKVSAKRSWRKLHIVVDEDHYIQGATLTNRFVSDEKAVEEVVDQITEDVGHFTADGAYDKNPVYDYLSERFPHADIVIPPHKDAVYNKNGHPLRNRNVLEVESFGRMGWQRARNYGQRNYSELSIQRYKRILGNTLQSREFERQKQEIMIGCSILNKMTQLGMPQSHRT